MPAEPSSSPIHGGQGGDGGRPSDRGAAKRVLDRLLLRPGAPSGNADRPPVDRHELEQSALRVGIVGLVLVYLVYKAISTAGATAEEVAWVALATFVFSVVLLARIVTAGGVSVVRRVLGMIVDNAATSYCLLQMEEAGAIIIGVYLFVTFGNGFRYGRKYLHLSQLLALAGFGLVIALSDYWSTHASLSVGLLLALIVLPFYVAVLAQRITEAMNRADEANRAKGRFLANMSHEMRTPLNGVIAMADVLRETSLDDAQVEIVETMTTSAQLLLAQIEDVLDMAKIEAGRVTTEARPFELRALLASTVKVMQPQARYKGLDFSLTVAPEADGRYMGDAHHLRQVLLNLVSNAIKFTDRGAVSVSATLVDQTETERRVRIEVRDTGVGIPPEKQSQIFEPFTQADNSVTRMYGGTGLGTTIARHLVSLMNGSIGVQSEPGVGSLFWVEIPLPVTSAPAIEDAFALPPGIHARAVAQASSGRERPVRKAVGARILVAEDNLTNQRVAQLILESGGHRVTIVDNGEKALDALESGTFDIALFDLSMPVVSGLQALKMYTFSNKDHIPVLVLSANVTREAIDECYVAGAAEFVPKPLRASLLLDAIERQLSGHAGARRELPAPDDAPALAGAAAPDLDPGVVAELRRLSPDPTFVERLFNGFLGDADRLLAEIREALAAHRVEAVKDAAHALKGGSASVGAMRLCQLATALEKSDHEALAADAAAWADRLAEAVDATRDKILAELDPARRRPASAN